MAIPRKGSACLRLCVIMANVAVWCRYLSSSLVVCPHSAASPTAHPGRVDTRNEICLTANEILLRKVKSVCDG